jgi:hypothetical protein
MALLLGIGGHHGGDLQGDCGGVKSICGPKLPLLQKLQFGKGS